MKLPFFGKRPSVSAAPTQPGALSTTGDVLVCEMDPFYREAIAVILKEAGCKVAMADTVEGALAVLRAGGLRLILSDVEIGKGEQGGFQVLAEAKGNLATKRVPFVFLTSVADMATIDRATSFGIADYFIKSHSDVAHLKELILKYV